MTTESKLLAKLKKQEQELKEKIKQAEKSEKKKQAAIYAKKCAIIGAAILDEMEEDENLKSTLQSIIEKRVIAVNERKILRLDPLTKKENIKDAESSPANAG